ncbi:hypothetical protein AB5I39_13835 [Sphingomonas sp. MMS24-J45]
MTDNEDSAPQADAARRKAWNTPEVIEAVIDSTAKIRTPGGETPIYGPS